MRRLATTFTAGLLAATLTAQGCAFLLYPERRNQPAGTTIDTVPLIIDIVWFIPGIIPGVVCLAVDFVTNSIYVHGGSGQKKLGKVRPGSRLTLRNSVQLESDAAVRMALIGPEGELVDEVRTTWGPERARHKIAVRVPKNAPEVMKVALEVEGYPTVEYSVDSAG